MYLPLSFSLFLCYIGFNLILQFDLKGGNLILRDCDHCFHDRSHDCSRLTCIGFKPVGSIDIEVIETAAKAHDNRNHGQSRYGSRRTQEAEARYHNAQASKRFIEQGRTLWYKHKRTGDICSGVVEEARPNEFLFRFGNRAVYLAYDVINSRLFYTKDEARRYGRTEK